MSESLFFNTTQDFSGTDRFGSTLPAGNYVGEVIAWQARLKSEDKLIHDIDFVITGEDKFAGESLRYWHTVMRGGRTSPKSQLMALLEDLQIITEEEQRQDSLEIKMHWSEEDDYGRRELLAIEVNGEERTPIGAKAELSVTVTKNSIKSSPNYGKEMNFVTDINPIGDAPDVSNDDINETLDF